jgi:hypothetical protein
MAEMPRAAGRSATASGGGATGKEAGEEAKRSKQTDAVVDVMLRAGHMQVAAMTATSRFLSLWAQTADRYAQSLGTEICDVIEGRTASGEGVTRFADATASYLRELTELPGQAVRHYEEQIAKEPRNRAPRTRRARAKG